MNTITTLSATTKYDTHSGTTHTITVEGDLTCTDFIRYCVSLAKSQGYMLTNIADALAEAHCETVEELDLYEG
jgi:hypothetical protein